MSIIYNPQVKICHYLINKKTYLNFEKRFLTYYLLKLLIFFP